jgi:hypothetical protein
VLFSCINVNRMPAFGARSSRKQEVAGLMAMVAVVLFACGPANAAVEDVGGLLACRVAVEEVLWNHRIWPPENPGPKPTQADP